jgi:hypothetical protein
VIASERVSVSSADFLCTWTSCGDGSGFYETAENTTRERDFQAAWCLRRAEATLD